MNPTQLHEFNPDLILMPKIHPETARTNPGQYKPSISIAKGTLLGRINVTAEVQSVDITGSPSGGTFTLTFDGETTASLDHDCTAAEMESALEALPNIGVGGVAVTGTNPEFTVTFLGSMGNVDQMTSTSSLTGGTSPGISHGTDTSGLNGSGKLAAYDNGASDGTQTCVGIAMYSFCTDASGNIFVNSDSNTTPSMSNPPVNSLPYYISGAFLLADLTGHDSAATADLQARIDVTANGTILYIPD